MCIYMHLNRCMHIFTHEILHCTSQTFICCRDKQIGLLGWNPGISGACFVASLCVALSAASTTIVCLVIFLFAINVMMIISTRRGASFSKMWCWEMAWLSSGGFYHSHFQIPTPAEASGESSRSRSASGEEMGILRSKMKGIRPLKKGDHFRRIIFQSQHHFKRNRIVLQVQHFFKKYLSFQGSSE